MAILIHCTSCHASLKVKDEYAGRVGICPDCGHAIHIASFLEDTQRALPRPATDELKQQAASLGITFDERTTYKALHHKIEAVLEAQTEILDDSTAGY